MTIITKETITAENGNVKAVSDSSSNKQATGSQTFEYLVYYFFGALDIILAFRLVLKLAGASAGSFFVKSVYAISRFFIIPFEGIFKRGYTQGTETTSVLEPSTLVAIIVYAVLAVGIVKLIRISSGEEQQVD